MATAGVLQPGVTELALAPALDSDELRAIDPDADDRVDDLRVLIDDDLDDALDAVGAVRIGYRELRQAQRDRR